MRRQRPWAPLLAGASLLLVAATIACSGGSQAAANPTVATTSVPVTAPSSNRSATPSPPPTPVSSLDPDLQQLVSKGYALPDDYAPGDLVTLSAEWAVPGFAAPVVREVAADPLVRLLEAARADGLEIRIRSSYRSYATQQATFQFWVDQHGLEQARRESAEAGHSEHQLGTTVDFASESIGWELFPEFGDAREGQWLAARAWQYGFAMSYPRGAESITGYIYEPWHFRYIGRSAAAGWHASGLTLIEYLLALYGDSAPAPSTPAAMAPATPAPPATAATAAPETVAPPATGATAAPETVAPPATGATAAPETVAPATMTPTAETTATETAVTETTAPTATATATTTATATATATGAVEPIATPSATVVPTATGTIAPTATATP